MLDNDIDRARGQFIMLKDLMEKPFVFEDTSRREHLRGLILLAEGRTAGALEALEEAVRRSPRDFLFFGREHARVLLETGDTDEALSKALELAYYNPNDPLLLMILCRANRIKGDMVSAKEYYDRTIEVLGNADEDYLPLIEFKAEFADDPGI
jgi:predicted Zn-dependent protease